MRSLSVKKVAVAAAGAALLGMAFAGATTVDPSVGNYVFFKNGQPQVQIVVGSNANISDGVAAAEIAAALGNLAYLNQPVTASAGNSTLSNSTSSGTVSGQSVTLSVSAPLTSGSSTTGNVIVNSQPYDFLEYKENVANVTRGDNGAQNSPIGDGVSTGGYEISGDNSPSIAFKGSLSNIGSNTITEDERLFLVGESYYTTSTGIPGSYTADRMQVADEYNFTTPIPYYVGSTLGSASNNSAGTYVDQSGNTILSTDPNFIINSNTAINFLGQPYVITGFPSAYGTSGVVPTSSTLSLGAQAVTQQLSPGGSVTVGNTTVTVLSISPIATGSTVQPVVAFQIAQNGTVLQTLTLQQGQSQTSGGVVVKAQQVFVGSGSTSYVQVSVYSQALSITSGQQIAFTGNNVWTTADNGQSGGPVWTANLVWVNQTVGSINVPALSAITLTSQPSGRVPVGSSFNLLTEPVAKQLTFLGLQQVPTDTLRVFAVGNQRFNINQPTNPTEQTPYGYSSSLNNANTNGYNYVEVQSTDANAFQIGTQSVSTLYINKDLGSVLIKDVNDGNYTYVAIPTLTSLNWPLYSIGTTSVTYHYPSSPMSNAFTVIDNISNTTNIAGAPNTALVSTANDSVLRIYEPVVANDVAGALGLGHYKIDLYTNTSDNNYGNDLFNSAAINVNSNTLGEVYNAYAPGLTGSVNFGNGTEQVGYISPGGSKLTSVSVSEADIAYPQSLPVAQWWFGSPSNVTVGPSGSSTSTVTLSAGQNYTLGPGYTVSVSSLGGTASCSGSSATTTSAVCTPSTAAVVTMIDPASLVILDTAANPNNQNIIVGGPYVNSVAASLPGADTATEAPGDSVVTVIGNDVLVAGYSAQDTANAATALVQWLDQNSNTVRQ